MRQKDSGVIQRSNDPDLDEVIANASDDEIRELRRLLWEKESESSHTADLLDQLHPPVGKARRFSP